MSGTRFKDEKRLEIPQSGRTDYEYTWEGTDSLLGTPVLVALRVVGTRVAALDVAEEIAAPSAGKGISGYFEVGEVGIIIALGITMVIVAIRRIRAYEIGWRTAVVMGVVGGVLFGLDMYISMMRGLNIVSAVSLLIAPTFVGGFIILSWAVAESVGREVWKEKFVPLDLLTRGHVLDSRVATAVLAGLAGGAVARVVWSCVVWLLARVAALRFIPDATQLFEYVARPAPALSMLAHHAYSQIFVLSAFLLFPLAIARRRIASPWVLSALGSLLVVLTRKAEAEPYLLGLLIEWASMTVVVGVLCRRDLLAGFVALVTAPVLSVLPVFLRSADPAMLLSGEAVLLLFGLMVLVSWIGVLTRDRVTDLEAITPAFARHISERERLQQELRIARDVQMSLLPKTTPSVAGLDLAARCVPAQEVGGDYYDFAFLDGGRLGVVIGDVSGKGTEGAFYMTLTKGFLKAVVKASESPATVLTQANALFCENVGRGNFISMVYASIDVQGGKVTFARAGHNPVILYRARSGSAEFFQPKGIALGLESGEVFARTIEEVSIQLERGDVLVLYTDGFGEAMNKAREMYGEARLQEAIVRLAGGSSEEILGGILKDARSFAGRAEQNDDMTMVVIKKT
jgi:sigma-B regulation protein RsbU (phosphoserine phosphatase)